MAQVNVSPQVRRGMATAWSAGISLAKAPGVSNDMLLKHPNPSQNPTTIWAPNPAVVGPDYSIAAMFAGYPDIEIDAHSSGNGTIPRQDQNGAFYTGATTPWVAIVASVGIEADGTPTSLWRQAKNLRAHPGAELVGYYLTGSTGLNDNLAGSAAFEATRPSLNFQAVGPDSALDIDALDYGIGMFTNGAGTMPSSLFMVQGQYYFSVSPEWCDDFAANYPNQSFAHSNVNRAGLTELPDPRVVYHISWDQANGWNEPYVAYDETYFGLSEADNLDALDIDLMNRTMIFSSLPDGLPSQIMFLQAAKPGAATGTTHAVGPVPMQGSLAGTGANADVAIGLTGTGDDDVRSLCGIDPEGDGYYFHVGIPKGYPSADSLPMGLSMCRSVSSVSANGTLADDITLEVAGWGSGSSTLCLTEWQLFAGVVTDPFMTSMSDDEWLTIDFKVRQPTDDVISLTIPGVQRPVNRLPILVRARNHVLVGNRWVVNGLSWNVYSTL